MIKDIDHWQTDEIVCPYCGYEFSDSWQYIPNNNEGQEDCPECGETFQWWSETTVTYTTSKIEEKYE